MGDNPDAAFHAIEYFMNSFKSIQWNMPFKFITSDKNIQKESNDDSKGMNTIPRKSTLCFKYFKCTLLS